MCVCVCVCMFGVGEGLMGERHLSRHADPCKAAAQVYPSWLDGVRVQQGAVRPAERPWALGWCQNPKVPCGF